MIFTLLIISGGIVGMFIGMHLGRINDAALRKTLVDEGERLAAGEYDRGLRDGFAEGIDHGVHAARRAINNQRKLAELAARRFSVGGLRAHE